VPPASPPPYSFIICEVREGVGLRVTLGSSCPCGFGDLDAGTCLTSEIVNPTYISNPRISFTAGLPAESLDLAPGDATLAELPGVAGACPDGYWLCDDHNGATAPMSGYRCLKPVAPSECPLDPTDFETALDLAVCDSAVPGDLCLGDGSCQTSNILNNCGTKDVYHTVYPIDSNVRILTKLTAPCTIPLGARYSRGHLRYDGAIYYFDVRLETIENTVTSPGNVSYAESRLGYVSYAESTIREHHPYSSVECPNVPKTFLNAEGCRRDVFCHPPAFSHVPLTLNESTLRSFHTIGDRDVLAVTGLRFEHISYRVSPCIMSGFSRWKKIGEGGTSAAAVGAPPSAPVASGSYTHPSQCAAGRCCGVLLRGAAGSYCQAVPIWDFTDWTHPGGDVVRSTRLCGLIKYDWLIKSTTHSSMVDPQSNDLESLPYGAVKVGLYVDEACAPPAPPAPPVSCENDLDSATVDTLVSALRASTDPNPYVHDVPNPRAADRTLTCNVPTPSGYVGVKVLVDGVCWQHVNPHEYDVRDFSYWSATYPWNSPTSMPIQSIASAGGTWYEFPADFSMARWVFYGTEAVMPTLGKYGDVVDLADLPQSARTPAIAEAFGAVDVEGESSVTEVCGSPFEVANVPAAAHRYGTWLSKLDAGNEALFRNYNQFNGKSMVHTTVSLYADDQLRQRVAWALSQIYIVGISGLKNKDDENEIWHSYYDIFVRHAFGNLRDVMREVSYSPQMAVYLSYLDSASFASSGNHPDENYARESMQLFSIGLWDLWPDGNRIVEGGSFIQTYGSNEVVTFAKVWTGFGLQPFRGNIESKHGLETLNYIDPMHIDPLKRDHFPKMDLYHGYLGDGYPLCTALPPQAFLRRGAKYRYLASGMAPQLQTDPDYANTLTEPQPRLHPRRTGSALYRKLCWPELPADTSVSAFWSCTFASEVLLDANLPCDGVECAVEKPRVVGIEDADGSVTYYEYVPPPCVYPAFFEGGRLGQRYATSWRRYLCLDPNAAHAGATCCEATGTRRRSTAACGFIGERVEYATAESRCTSRGERACPRRINEILDGDNPINATQSYQAACGLRKEYVWLDVPCTVEAQVNDEGMVSLVHSGVTGIDDADRTMEISMPDNGNYFRVRWADGQFPASWNNCSQASACRLSGTTCLCATSVETVAAFTDAAAPPSRQQVEEMLHVGSASPESFDSGIYTECTSSACASVANEVAIFTRNGAFDEHTIFRIAVNGSARVIDLANVRSTVRVQGTEFTFRNPPRFMVFHDPAERDAHYETDALIDHLFYHKNLPPFITYRLIQRFTTSNPSTRYMNTVCRAFRTGWFNGRVYSGKYGYLSATVAAILLDPEGSSPILDLDASHGSVREPLIKLFHLMRAMEFVPEDGREVETFKLTQKIGQRVYESPDVFSFFLPEYSAAGPLADAKVVAPEAQRATSSALIGFLNGAMSLIRNGLNSCDEGLGGALRGCALGSANPRADGYLTWRPGGDEMNSANVVDQLDLLLTAGRMPNSTRAIVARAYSVKLSATGSPTEAKKVAQELMMASTEFSTFGDSLQRGVPRSEVPDLPFQNRTYKALIYLFLSGGADTFNMLVPHSGCRNASGTHDLYEEYAATRTMAAIPKNELRSIDVTGSNQPCDTLGLHPMMPFLQSAYDAGEALMYANVGCLSEPVTKRQVIQKNVTVPLSLFAHNIQIKTVHTGDPSAEAEDGVGGRILKALETTAQYRGQAWSLSGKKKMVDGNRLPFYMQKDAGFTEWSRRAELGDDVNRMLTNESKSPFAETIGNGVLSGLARTQFMVDLLDGVQTVTNFDTTDTMYGGTSKVASAFYQVARVIRTRHERQVERDIFYVGYGGWDTHNVVDTVPEKFHKVDEGLSLFVAEMKAQGLWDQVVIQEASEFGRTLTSNGRGTDHGWGGNAFVLGGSVRGGRVLGTYPSSMRADSEFAYNGNNGRMIPTTSWEATWKPIAQWLGVDEASMAAVIPQVTHFPPEQIFSQDQVFHSGA